MIYFVEDDASIRELVVYTLTNAGYEVEGFGRPSTFWRWSGSGPSLCCWILCSRRRTACRFCVSSGET